jgi:hypothetical protein
LVAVPETGVVAPRSVVVSFVSVFAFVAGVGAGMNSVIVFEGVAVVAAVVFVAVPVVRGTGRTVTPPRQEMICTLPPVAAVLTCTAGGRHLGIAPLTTRARTSLTTAPARTAGRTSVRPLGMVAGRIRAWMVLGVAVTQLL